MVWLGELVPVELEEVDMVMEFSQGVVMVVEIVVKLFHDDEYEQVDEDVLHQNDEEDEIET